VSPVHETTHRWLVASQTRPASPQSPSATHCTHVFVVVSQTLPAPPAPVQFVSLVHWTQRIVVVLQTGPVTARVHAVLSVHVGTQVPLVVSHAIPASPHWLSETHWTQAPAVEQCSPARQFVSVRHATQTLVVPQYGVGAVHIPSPEHGVPVGPASSPPLEAPEELAPLDEAPELEAPLEDPPPSSPVTPELAPDVPELVPLEVPLDPPPEEPPSPLPGGVVLLLPPQPIPTAMAIQTLTQALEAYIRPPPSREPPVPH
jgi:hypothetical protein